MKSVHAACFANRVAQAIVLTISGVGFAHAATATAEATLAASAAMTRPAASTPGVGKPPVVKTPTTAGTIANKGGNSQYPTGSIPIPPKPKKEGLEQTPAVKANVKAAQP